MTDVLKHRFVSGKLDGADTQQVQPSAWNDGHRLIGGNHGDLLTRDTTDPNFGAKWTPAATPWIDIPFSPGAYQLDDGSPLSLVVGRNRYRSFGNAVFWTFAAYNINVTKSTTLLYIFNMPFTVPVITADATQAFAIGLSPWLASFAQPTTFTATGWMIKRGDQLAIPIGMYYLYWNAMVEIVPA